MSCGVLCYILGELMCNGVCHNRMYGTSRRVWNLAVCVSGCGCMGHRLEKRLRLLLVETWE